MLAGWLTKAAAVFGRADAPPEPFEVACECGGFVSGLRTQLQQKLTCAHCGRPVWILPANVYPAISPARAAPVRPRVNRAVVAPESDAEQPCRRRPVPERGKGNQPSQKTAATASGAATDREASTATAASPPESLLTLPIPGRGRRYAFRLVVAAMVALVAVTGWSLRNRHLREQARAEVPALAEAGLRTLRKGDFSTADRQLGSAVRGLDLLRQNDPWAQTIRRAAQEAAAANNLSPLSILDLAEEVLSATGTDDQRQRRFQSQHGQEWMIWDVGCLRKSDPSGIKFELDAPFGLEKHPLQVECDFPELRQTAGEATSFTPQRVIFAAQIDRWIIPERSSQPIVAILKSSTAFLWTDYESFATVGYRPGFPGDEEKTRDILTRQRQQVLP